MMVLFGNSFWAGQEILLNVTFRGSALVSVANYRRLVRMEAVVVWSG
jgi:hypothetical protein